MINPGVVLFLLTGYSERRSVTLENSSRPENGQRGPGGPERARGARKGCFSENNGSQIPVHLI